MNEKIIAALNWRYATKEFDPTKKVSETDLHTILESARLAPSSIGIEAWKFIVVENPEVRQQLLPAANNQRKVTEASHLIVLAYRTDMRENIADERIERTARIENKTEEELTGLRKSVEGGITAKSDAELMAWSRSQVYIPLGMMIETASLLGIDNCGMEGFKPDQVDAILGLPAQNLHVTSMLAIGYRSESDVYAFLPKVRRSFEEVVEFIK